MAEEKFELVKFVDNGFELEVKVSPSENTVWLDADAMANLFGVNSPAIVKHTNNIIQSGELDESTCSILEQVQMEGIRRIRRKSKGMCIFCTFLALISLLKCSAYPYFKHIRRERIGRTNCKRILYSSN